MNSLSLPSDYARIRIVDCFEELLTARFENGINALCWPRILPGNFQEIVELLDAPAGINALEDAQLQNLPASAAGRVAIGVMLEDQRLLRDHGLEPLLNCIHGYPRDEDPGPVATDVFSFHSDSAPVEADTWLCTYYGAPSEGLRQEQSVRRVDLPAIRAALLELHGGPDDDDFVGFLNDHCYDLHYAALPGAQPFSFGLGNLWRIAIDWPGSPVPPCIHRAPETMIGEGRLLLIS